MGAAQAQNGVQKHLHTVLVDAGDRLVQHQQVGGRRDGQRQQHPLQFAAGAAPQGAAQQFLRLHSLQRCQHLCPGLSADTRPHRAAGKGGGEKIPHAYRHLPVEDQVLRYIAGAQVGNGPAAAVHMSDTPRGLHLAQQGADQRGLARTVLPDENRQLPAMNVHGHIVEQFLTATDDGDLLQLDVAEAALVRLHHQRMGAMLVDMLSQKKSLLNKRHYTLAIFVGSLYYIIESLKRKGLAVLEEQKQEAETMIALACDHTGLALKQEIKNLLDSMGLTYKDFGNYENVSDDYPIFGYRAAKAVASGECDRGILICGTGVGIGIAAGKVKGIRVCTCSDVYSAKLSKQHNNSNILTMGARVVGSELAKMIAYEWLTAEFEGGRHQKRIDMIEKIERGEEIE